MAKTIKSIKKLKKFVHELAKDKKFGIHRVERVRDDWYYNYNFYLSPVRYSNVRLMVIAKKWQKLLEKADITAKVQFSDSECPTTIFRVEVIISHGEYDRIKRL